MKITKESCAAWKIFLDNQDNRGHAKRVITGDDIDEHVNACWGSALNTVNRIQEDLPDLKPKRILEIGCSTGLNCYALQELYPTAKVIGIEPEYEALRVAKLMMNSELKTQPEFFQGFGEKLPFSDGSIDLIVCHTVIEHVDDVAKVIEEIARVLSEYGAAHVDAPNYRFPYEPHLGIFTVPGFGKKFVKLTALIQGQWRHREFVNHLKFVNPRMLEQTFEKYQLEWHNRAVDKLYSVAIGSIEVKKYRFIANILKILTFFKISSTLLSIISALGLYPSVLYTLRKRNHV
jgi:ubiquinone/menaquinone biosynthesis C-methylase UbiE